MKISTLIIVTIFLLIFPPSISAQVNTEKFRKNFYEEGLSGHLELDFSSRSGNVDITEVTVEHRNDYVWKNMITFVIIKGDYGWQGGSQYSDEALVHLRNVFKIKANLQPEIFTQIDYNKKRLLTFRGLIGGGFRFAINNNNITKLWYGASLMVEHERLDLSGIENHEENTKVIRWSSYLSSNINFNEQIIWTSTTYFQPIINDLKDIRLLSETNLELRLIKRLSLILGFQMRYDSEPPKGIKSFDTTLRTGIGITF